MMKQTAKAKEQERRAQARLRVLHHHEQVTRNVSQTCRFFGISRTLFYRWRERYRQEGLVGLHEGPRGPRHHPFTTPPHIVALILEIRRERQYGPLRIRFFLEGYHQVYVSAPTIYRILKQHRVPRVSLKRYRPGPRRRRDFHVPGQSVQIDVKHLKLGGRRFYQFTAIDEATRYRVLRVYAHNSIKSATDFVEEVRRRLPMAIQRIQTDHGSEFGTDFTWHLRDLGVSHRQIPRGCQPPPPFSWRERRPCPSMGRRRFDERSSTLPPTTARPGPGRPHRTECPRSDRPRRGPALRVRHQLRQRRGRRNGHVSRHP